MVCMQADGSYQYTMEKPDEGWTAFFIQVYVVIYCRVLFGRGRKGQLPPLVIFVPPLGSYIKDQFINCFAAPPRNPQE